MTENKEKHTKNHSKTDKNLEIVSRLKSEIDSINGIEKIDVRKVERLLDQAGKLELNLENLKVSFDF